MDPRQEENAYREPYMKGYVPRQASFSIKDSRGKVMTFYAGALLMYGVTNAGKSTTSLGMVFECALQNVKAGHMVWDEVGASEDTYLTPTSRVAKEKVGSLFEVPTNQIVEPSAKIINSYLARAYNAIVTEGLSLLVIDSIGPSLSVASGLVDQPAGKGAMVEGYGMYLRMLNAIAYNTRCTIVCVVNSSLFTVSSLEGAVDGTLEINGRGSVMKRDRTDRSVQTQFTISAKAILKAMEAQGSKNIPQPDSQKGII